MLTDEACDSMKPLLPGFDRNVAELEGNLFRWCEVDSSVENLPFSTEYDGRSFTVVSADPSRVLQWRPGWEFREIESIENADPEQPHVRSLGIDLDNEGATRMRELTKTNLGNRMAIIVGGKVVSAPTIRGEIGGRAQITGNFSDEEWERLKGVLFAATSAPQDSPRIQQEPGDGALPESPTILKRFVLRNIKAAEANSLLVQPYGHKVISAIVTPNSNLLIVRGSPECLEEIEASLLRLDEQDRGESDETLDLPKAVPQFDVNELRQVYTRHQQEAGRLAAAIHELKSATVPDTPQLEDKLAKLRQVVQWAFETRQQIQRVELEQLRERLLRIERQLAARERAKQQIIDRRVEELTN